MKATILISIAMLIAELAYANSFESAILQAKQKLEQSATTSESLQSAQQLERIARAEQNSWIAQYYTAYGYLLTCTKESDEDKKEHLLEKAETYIDKAFELQGDQSELFALRGFWYSLYISASPLLRGPMYGYKLNENLQKSIEINAKNPRAYYLLGQMAEHSPEMFGGGKPKAAEWYQKAETCYSGEKPSCPVLPTWGKEANTDKLKQLLAEMETLKE